MVVGIMALVAQAERRMISRAHQGGAAGGQGARRQARQSDTASRRAPRPSRARGAATSAASAQAFAERLRPVLAELADLSANAAAAELDRRGIATARGGKWTARSVIDVRQRLKRPRPSREQ